MPKNTKQESRPGLEQMSNSRLQYSRFYSVNHSSQGAKRKRGLSRANRATLARSITLRILYSLQTFPLNTALVLRAIAKIRTVFQSSLTLIRDGVYYLDLEGSSKGLFPFLASVRNLSKPKGSSSSFSN